MEIEQERDKSSKTRRLIPNLEQTEPEELEAGPKMPQKSFQKSPNLGHMQNPMEIERQIQSPEQPLPPNPPPSMIEVIDMTVPITVKQEEQPGLSDIYGTPMGPSIDEISERLGVDNFSYMLEYESEMKKSNKRGVLKTKKKIVREMGQLNELRDCISKHHLRLILKKLEPKWKFLMKLYLNKYLISDLYSRKLENTSIILTSRKTLIRSIEDPDLLEEDCHFDNNTVKNFSKGFVIFYTKHLDELDPIYEASLNEPVEEQDQEGGHARDLYDGGF